MKNMNTWSLLRVASLDIGRKFTYRIFIYCSVFLAFYIAYFTFVMLAFFGILQNDLPLTVYITGIFDILVVLGILMMMMKYGAEINEYFDIFKGIFIQYKNYMWDIKVKMDCIRNNQKK
mmetsp:Transcript_13267/g.11740  ORF Transcript_13267/g.11740 Transcript_13267/m.11740 type:complete len:119 (+) Transcript_13267:1582-1938(+)